MKTLLTFLNKYMHFVAVLYFIHSLNVINQFSILDHIVRCSRNHCDQHDFVPKFEQSACVSKYSQSFHLLVGEGEQRTNGSKYSNPDFSDSIVQCAFSNFFFNPSGNTYWHITFKKRSCMDKIWNYETQRSFGCRPEKANVVAQNGSSQLLYDIINRHIFTVKLLFVLISRTRLI